ncbi:MULTISPECIES: sulfite exporter TauE/SafE family protein [Providencia]|uniref:sulfite exporter TauE/SafE family protein n=1 Tax=Providencia TaxID=586 RepID=UPI0008393352|nr:sulfite exporter TauE/SafE family protein [Providencia heimbachae]MBP6120915.1 sulfite exporter TauE/SafE family protein [Providencia sp.]NIH23458.1 sulfite exporter TauE/SafE family protein [Providencia heimbachae]
MEIIISVFLLAGFIKGVIGLGLPTIAMGLLSITMEPIIAASLLIIPSLVTNAWQLLMGPKLIELIKRFWLFIMGIFIGTFWGFFPTLSSSTSWTLPALGIVLVIYGIWGVFTKKLPLLNRHEKYLSPIIGYITGAITAATGVFVIPAVPYLQSLQLNKNELIQALGIGFIASTVALAIQLSFDNQFGKLNYSLSAIALVPAIIGMYLGQYLRNKISEMAFRYCFFIGLVLLGCYMIAK